MSFSSLSLSVVTCAVGLWLASASGVSLAQQTGADLVKQRACLGCHMVERKMIGPAFKDVAAKYAAQPDGAAVVATSILNGSKGKWGVIPMAPNKTVKEGEAALLADWLLSLK